MKKNRAVVIDIALTIALALAGAGLVLPVFKALGSDHLEGRFGVVLYSLKAPIMFAAGLGMRLPDESKFPEVEDFYRLETSAFDPHIFPKDYEGSRLTNSYPYMHYYLMYAIGWAWRLFGVSYFSLHLLCIFLYAIMTATLYCLFRFGMGRILSIAATVLSAASPAYLMSCPSLRDFGKAPFILACFVLLGFALTQHFSRRKLLLWSVFYAFIAGIGYGFRQDLLICIPPAVVVLLLFMKIKTANPILTRVWASIALILIFSVIAIPVFYGMHLDHGSASAQAFVQGVSTSVEDKQDFGYASYSMHQDYSDYYDFTIVNSYARRTGDTEKMEGHFNAAHGKAGDRYMREVMRRFPADMFARGLASLASLSFINIRACVETEHIFESYGHLLRIRAILYRPLSEHLKRWGMAYIITALFVLCCNNLQIGMATVLLFVYFGAYPSLLYDFRHYFYLAFIPYWACGYLLTCIIRLLFKLASRLSTHDYTGLHPWSVMKKAGAGLLFSIVFISALAGVLVTSRFVQKQKMNDFLDVLQKSEIEEVKTEWIREGDQWLLKPVSTLPEFTKTPSIPGFETTGEYLVVSLRHTDCPLVMRLLYDDKLMVNFSEWANPQPGIKGHTGTYQYFFPAYELAWPGIVPGALNNNGKIRVQFKGLLVPEIQRPMIQGLYRVKNAGTLSLWPHVSLTETRADFIPFKSGPIERFFAAACIEVCSCFGWHGDMALEGYMRLIRRYPGYKPFEDKAIRLCKKEKKTQNRFHMFSLLLRDYPHLYGKVANELESSFSKISDRSDLQPLDPWSKTLYGRHLEMKGDLDGAQDMFFSALAMSPENRDPAECLDNWYMANSDSEERLIGWEHLHTQYPNAVVPEIHYGMALENIGKLEESRQIYLSILQQYPEHTLADIRLSLLTIKQGQLDDGISLLKGIMERNRNLEEQIGMECAELAEYFLMASDYQTATRLYSFTIETAPDNFWHRVHLGECFELKGDLESALQQYKTVLMKSPESPVSAQKLQDLLVRMQTPPEEILAEWQVLSDAYPEAVVPLKYLGMALESLGQTDEARSDYRKALNHNQEFDPAACQLAALDILARNMDQGLAELRDIARDYPDQVSDISRRLGEIAGTFMGQEKTEEAVHLYKTALELSPKDLWPQVHLGEIYETQGQYENALDAYRSVLTQKPESPVSARKLQDLLVKMQTPPETVLGMWRAISEQHPEAAVPLYYLGMALEAAGDLKGAEEAVRRSMEINPDIAATAPRRDAATGPHASEAPKNR